MTGNSRKRGDRGRRGVIVQERDRQLLRELSVMRVADREQLALAAGFHSTTRANARLLQLTRAGLLRRFFTGTSAGGKKALYALSQSGADLVQVPSRGPRRRQDETLVADSFVQHQLAVNDIYGTVKFAPIPVAGATFLRWMAFHEPLTKASALIPDGYFEISVPSSPESARELRAIPMFLEVDLGHEGRSVWKAKVESYLRYAVSGVFASQFGDAQESRFRVLAILTSERRLESLRRVTASVTDRLFWFSTFDSLNREGFWSPVWLRPTGDAKQSLL